MKKITVSMLFCFLLALTVVNAQAQTYFFDDFENATESAKKWEVISGDWQLGDGVYHQLAEADPWQAAVVSKDYWQDGWVEYTIEVKIKPLTEGDAPANILFRLQDPVPQVWGDRSSADTHMYRWIINGWDNAESRPYMYNGGQTEMVAQADNTLVVGNWHDIKLVVTATGCAGYVDGAEMFNAEHAQWTDGRVGIQAYNGKMDFDNFVVYGPEGTAAVSAMGKMSTSWAEIKASY